jgi:hypothetical protein
MPSSVKSVVTRMSRLEELRSTAQSSPMPAITPDPRVPLDAPAMRRISEINALSGIGTAFTIPPVICPIVTADYPSSVTEIALVRR